ncbi:MAG TPA: hypothetical protein VFF37_03305 [Streptomyces sp.]|nr:hypothetical protein [Streptomyces sp.]
MRLGALRTLRFESDRLPPDVINNVAAADLPALECLEMWIGDEETPWEGLATLLAGDRFARCVISVCRTAGSRTR